VNCTLEALTDGLVDVLAPRTTVLEVLERIEPTPALAKTCERLKSMGYRIALDDFQWVEGIEPLVALADYIKVDFLQSDAAERSAMLERLRGSRAVLLAEKVETREEFEQASREGFTLFQGYFFCRPDVMTKRDIPANAMAQMELLRELQQKDLDFRAVSRVVERDPAITYRLLRTVNAAGTGVRGELFSVEKALMALGEDRFRRMVTLAVAAALSSGGSKEALRLALFRARFCELGAALTGREGTEQYLLGLFSLLPAMLQISMEEAVETIGPRAEIREALMGECNHDSRLLRWVEFYMRGE
jgi:EAL and modified HD-GYP domain-containing signal transduction protein